MEPPSPLSKPFVIQRSSDWRFLKDFRYSHDSLEYILEVGEEHWTPFRVEAVTMSEEIAQKIAIDYGHQASANGWGLDFTIQHLIEPDADPRAGMLFIARRNDPLRFGTTLAHYVSSVDEEEKTLTWSTDKNLAVCLPFEHWRNLEIEDLEVCRVDHDPDNEHTIAWEPINKPVVPHTHVKARLPGPIDGAIMYATGRMGVGGNAEWTPNIKWAASLPRSEWAKLAGAYPTIEVNCSDRDEPGIWEPLRPEEPAIIDGISFSPGEGDATPGIMHNEGLDMPWCEACGSYHVPPRSIEHAIRIGCKDAGVYRRLRDAELKAAEPPHVNTLLEIERARMAEAVRKELARPAPALEPDKLPFPDGLLSTQEGRDAFIKACREAKEERETFSKAKMGWANLSAPVQAYTDEERAFIEKLRDKSKSRGDAADAELAKAQAELERLKGELAKAKATAGVSEVSDKPAYRFGPWKDFFINPSAPDAKLSLDSSCFDVPRDTQIAVKNKLNMSWTTSIPEGASLAEWLADEGYPRHYATLIPSES